MKKILTDFDEKSVLLEERKQKFAKIRYRICKKCGERKPISEFSADKRSRGGRTNICKKCRSLESLNYYYLNRDLKLLQVKQYNKEHKKERKAYSENYREDHKEHLRVEKKKYYRKNRKRIKKRNLQRRGANRIYAQNVAEN